MAPKEPTIKRESTSIKIDPELWKEAKIEAIREDIDLSELVEKAIQAWISKRGDKR
jgi:predicted HicB family RNase H-like nuclease